MSTAPMDSPGQLDYPWIYAWHAMFATSDTALGADLERARATMAPLTATFWDAVSRDGYPGGHWSTLDSVTLPADRAFMVDWASDYGLHIPDRVLRVWLTSGNARKSRKRLLSPPDL
jgi:hypothetical protein